MSRKIQCFECGRLLCTLENGSTIVKSGLRAFCVPDCKKRTNIDINDISSILDKFSKGFKK
jgi:hypothetical protein